MLYVETLIYYVILFGKHFIYTLLVLLMYLLPYNVCQKYYCTFSIIIIYAFGIVYKVPNLVYWWYVLYLDGRIGENSLLQPSCLKRKRVKGRGSRVRWPRQGMCCCCCPFPDNDQSSDSVLYQSVGRVFSLPNTVSRTHSS